MIVNVEKVSKCACHGRQCSICENEKATGRVYTQTRADYENHKKNVAFYFCEGCGLRVADNLKIYSR